MGHTQTDRQKQLIVALAHYLADGHQLDWTELAAHSGSACAEDEESHKLIVRDLEAFGQIYQRLKYERGW